jgi:hypothetical protein
MTAWELRLGDGNRRMVWKTFSCEVCRVKFSARVRPARSRRFCSRSCTVRVTKPQEHIGRGPDHPGWKGDAVSVKGGRTRALRMYRDVGPCTKCGVARSERHHKDGNTGNNSPENIEILCRRCHMSVDGRIDVVIEQMRAIQPSGVLARWRK